MTVAKATTAWYLVKVLEKSHRTLRVRKDLGVYLAQPPVLILSTSWQERGGLLNWLFGIYSLKENSSVMKAASVCCVRRGWSLPMAMLAPCGFPNSTVKA